MTHQSTGLEELLAKSLDVVADAITDHGDEYWPIYKRLEKELKKARTRKRQIKLSKARREL